MWGTPVPIKAVIVVLLAVGAAGVATEDVHTTKPDADALVEDVLDGDREFETIQGTRTTATEIGSTDRDDPRRSERTEDVWIRPPDKKRSELVATEGDPPLSNVDVRVYNGTLRQWYQEDEELLIVDDDWERGSHVEEFDARVFEQYDAEYLGTDAIVGRETYVVEITPKANASTQAALTLHLADREFDAITVSEGTEGGNVSYSTRWWIDVETGYPMKERVKAEHHDPEETPSSREHRVHTTTYEAVAYDDAIPDETFVLDPPEGTTVGDSPEQLNVETLEEADESVPFTVPEPPVPDRFERTWVLVWEFMDEYSVTVVYHDDDASDSDRLTFRFTEFPPPHTDEDVIRGGVGELDATAYARGGGDTVIYHCGGVRYEIQPSIHGADDVAFGADLADSLRCR